MSITSLRVLPLYFVSSQIFEWLVSVTGLSTRGLWWPLWHKSMFLSEQFFSPAPFNPPTFHADTMGPFGGCSTQTLSSSGPYNCFGEHPLLLSRNLPNIIKDNLHIHANIRSAIRPETMIDSICFYFNQNIAPHSRKVP